LEVAAAADEATEGDDDAAADEMLGGPLDQADL
jgi:hypothetical protein